MTTVEKLIMESDMLEPSVQVFIRCSLVLHCRFKKKTKNKIRPKLSTIKSLKNTPLQLITVTKYKTNL